MADVGRAEVVILDVKHGALPGLVWHLEVGSVGQADADCAHRGGHCCYAPRLHIFTQKGQVRGSHGVSGAKTAQFICPSSISSAGYSVVQP